MPALKLEQFGGMLPAWDPHLLPTGQSPSATNTYLFSGALQGWRLPKLLRALNNSAATFVYRIPTITQTPATVYLLGISAPQDGDTVTVGEQTYTFRSNYPLKAYEVKIAPAGSGGTAYTLLAAITGDNGAYTNQGPLKWYGNNTVANADVATLNEVPGYNNTIGTAIISNVLYEYLQLISPDFGAAYNTTAVLSNSGGRILVLANLSSLANTATTMTGGTNPSFSNDITAPSTWLEFVDPYTNVVKSEVVDDKFQRYYFMSPSEPPQYNTATRITAGNTGTNAPWLLGINPPGCAPTVNVSGGGSSATLGCATSVGGTTFIDGNTVYLIPIVPNGAMLLDDIQWMPQSTDALCSFAGVVYLDSVEGGDTPTTPGALFSVGEIVSGVTAGTLAESTFLNPPPLLQNTPYWIGICINNTESVSLGDGLNNSVGFTNTYTNGPPATAPAVTTHLPDLQMYADLTTSETIEARSYVYTWVSAYGEESAPSPFTLENGWSNGTWTIGLFLPPAADMGVDRNLAIIRLYRTVVGTGGSTVYYWVADISMGSTNVDAQAAVAADTVNGVPCSPPSNVYVDTIPDTTVALNIILPSTNYFPPPESLQGILALPNGMYVSWKGNELWMSQPYYPHAWPPGYVLTTDFPIIGLGFTQGTIVLCTASNAWVAIGSNPAQMSMNKCFPSQPCTSRGSIVSNDIGVFYISPNGLIQVQNTGTLTNVTELWVTMEKWAQLVPLKNAVAIPLASCYFCFGTVQGGDASVAQQGFNIEMNQDNTSFTIWPQPGGHRVGFNKMQSPQGFNIANILTDPWTSYGLIVQNGQVYWYDFQDPEPVMQPYDWQSKWYQQNTKKSYSAMRIFFTVPPGTPSNQAAPRNTAPPLDASWDALSATQWAIVKVWADVQDCAGDGALQLVCAREFRKSGELLRLPSGFKAETWMFEILGRVLVSNLQVATSAKELANV